MANDALFSNKRNTVIFSMIECSLFDFVMQVYILISVILGETGLGKSTLIDSLFNTSFGERTSTHFQPNVRLKAQTYDLQESNVRLKLTIISTVGFGDQINKDDRLVSPCSDSCI